MKKINNVLIALIVLVLIVAAIFLYQNKKLDKQVADLKQKAVPAEAKYTKGSVAFFYPADWLVNDIPAAEGMISVQVSDPKDVIVFVASSGRSYGDPKVNGELRYNKDIVFGDVSGKERLWEDLNSQAAVFRADNFHFQDRYYRFEMFSVLSRKVKAEKVWREILDSVKFAQSAEEKVEAKPAQ